MYEAGKTCENAKDYSGAMEWYRKAAYKNHRDAQNDLGVLYDHSRGAYKDYKQAFEWFSQAAENGLALAQLNVGYMYYKGKGVAKSYKSAMK
jgi:TPR repeat protein